MKFQIGERVTWTSQAGGHYKTKTGEIIALIEPGNVPYIYIRFRGGPSSPRKEVSYIVHANGQNYWPLVKNLQPDTVKA